MVYGLRKTVQKSATKDLTHYQKQSGSAVKMETWFSRTSETYRLMNNSLKWTVICMTLVYGGDSKLCMMRSVQHKQVNRQKALMQSDTVDHNDWAASSSWSESWQK